MKTVKALRWWIIVLVCLGTILNYLARNSLAVLAPELKQVFSISTQQYSYIVGAFQIGYTIMQPVCGFIVDLIGLRLGFALFAMLWSVVGVAHGFASGWLSLGILRGFLGLFEAAAIPSGMKAVAEWFPDREKSVAVGYFNAGTSLGAAIAPPLVVFLSMQFGWQAAFMATGALGFVWAALWYAQYRSPADHPRITPQERALIRDGQATMPPVSKRRIRDVVTARRFWAIALPRFFAEPAWQTFSFWIPLYLATERHMELKQIAIFAWMPFLAADLGGIAGGYLSPYLMKRFKLPLVWSRVAGVALGAVLMLGLTVWLVETMGLIGAGVAAVITQIVVAAMISPALWRVLHGDRAPGAQPAIDPAVAAADAGLPIPKSSVDKARFVAEAHVDSVRRRIFDHLDDTDVAALATIFRKIRTALDA